MGALNFEKNRLNEPIRFAEFNITTNQITVFSVTKIYNKAEKTIQPITKEHYASAMNKFHGGTSMCL